MPFSVGCEENHLFFIEEVEVFATKFFAVVYVVVGFEDETSLPKAAIND